jgi:hypothetical protein
MVKGLKHMNISRVTLVLCLVFGFNLKAEEHKAHVHGGGELSIAIEGKKIALTLEAPLETFLGFEHIAKSKEDKDLEKKLVKEFESPNFLIFNSGTCQWNDGKVTIDHHGGRANAHADVNADWQAFCEGKKPTSVKVLLFERYKSLKKLRVQMISDKKQEAIELTPEKTEIPL